MRRSFSCQPPLSANAISPFRQFWSETPAEVSQNPLWHSGRVMPLWRSTSGAFRERERNRKACSNINKFGGCPRTGCVAKVCYVLLGVIPYAKEEAHKQENPVTFPRNIRLCVFSSVAFRSQNETSTAVASLLCRGAWAEPERLWTSIFSYLGDTKLSNDESRSLLACLFSQQV